MEQLSGDSRSSKSPSIANDRHHIRQLWENAENRPGKIQGLCPEGKGQPSPWESLKNQIYLGSDEFIDDMQCKIDPGQSLKDIPKPQKNSPIKPLVYYKERYRNRNRAMAEAYRSGHYTLTEIGDEFGVSYATVSRAVKEYELKSEV